MKSGGKASHVPSRCSGLSDTTFDCVITRWSRGRAAGTPTARIMLVKASGTLAYRSHPQLNSDGI